MFSEPTHTTHLKYVKMLCRAFIREKMWEPLRNIITQPIFLILARMGG